MIEQVKELDAERGVQPFLEREILEYGEIHVLEARVTEDAPTHRTERVSDGRNHHRFAVLGHVAATGRSGQRSDIRGHLTRTGHRRGQRAYDLANPGAGRATHTGKVTATAREEVGRKAGAERKRTGGDLEVVRVPEEIPATQVLAIPGATVRSIVYGPRLRSRNRHDGVEPPAFEQLAEAF